MKKLPSSVGPRKARSMLASGEAREAFVPVHPEYARDFPCDTREQAEDILDRFCAKYGLDRALGSLKPVLLVNGTSLQMIEDKEGHCRILYARLPVVRCVAIVS